MNNAILLRYILLVGCGWLTVLLIQYFYSTIALRVVAVSIVLIQIQDNDIRPKVISDALELNPVLLFLALFLALFIGERIAGLLGVFLSIPIAGMMTLWMQPDREVVTAAADR